MLIRVLQMIPLSLYIHIPWCIKKCPYCDFNSHQSPSVIPEKAYIDKLLQDLEQDLSLIWGRKIISIFFGGGTPSLFSPSSYTYLLQQLHARLAFHPDIEITLEANPGTVEQLHFQGFREAGINRLSLGIQSFQSDKLQQLGRIHSAEQAEKAIENALLAGFSNFNIDLMYGLPQQTCDDALFDLKTAISYQPSHLSWYQLTLEPNTHFSRFPPTLPDDDAIWTMQLDGQALLAKNNYEQYEISAYQQNDNPCRHNLNYWQFGDYLGIGAGAHSKITDLASGNVVRTWKTKHPKQYLATTESFIAGERIIPKEELALEFLLNALRLHQPIPISLFEERTQLPFATFDTHWQKAITAGLLERHSQHINTTPLGKRFLNDLLHIFT